MKKISAGLLTFLMMMLMMPAILRAELSRMDDNELASHTGQALFLMDKVTGDGSSGSTGKGQSGVTFYKMGLDGVLDLNINIRKMQLGCGGINGVGCDLDIDNLSLSGPENCPGGRPNCDAQLTRPFVQFAIAGDDNPATRRVVGWRFSAEKAMGLLTMGYQDASMTDAASKNGLNSLSGYMNLLSATGTATTAVRGMCNTDCTQGTTTYPGLQTTTSATAAQAFGCTGANDPANGCNTGGAGQMAGRLYMNISLTTATADFQANTYALTMNSGSATVTTAPVVVSGKRLTKVDLTGTAAVGPVTFSGAMQANTTVLGINLSLNKEVTGTITGLTATTNISESLSFIHKITANNPFSLSLQQQDLLWPGAAASAQRGWWMAFEDPIDIGNISPQNQVVLTNKVLMQALTGASGTPWPTNNAALNGTNLDKCLVPSINCALYRGLSGANGARYDGSQNMGIHGVECFSLSACLSGSLPVGTMNVPVNLNLPLTDLKLSAQHVIPNCWGSYKFC